MTAREIRFTTHRQGAIELRLDVANGLAVRVTMVKPEHDGWEMHLDYLLDVSEQAFLVGWLMAQLGASGALSFPDELEQRVREAAQVHEEKREGEET